MIRLEVHLTSSWGYSRFLIHETDLLLHYVKFQLWAWAKDLPQVFSWSNKVRSTEVYFGAKLKYISEKIYLDIN